MTRKRASVCVGNKRKKNKKKRIIDDDSVNLMYSRETNDLLTSAHFKTPNELVGYCNGLICVRAMSNDKVERCRITVINPARNETLSLFYLNPITTRGGGNGIGQYLCHGFGFDSLSLQYKVVVIHTVPTTITVEAKEEFVCMVYTSGVTTWKRKVISISEITPPASSSFPLPRRRIMTRVRRECSRSGTLCGVDLYWKITNDIQEGGDTTVNEEEMLLSFDIRREKMQFI
ncbi:uncharacterized protein LOC113279633 [Papaver somniferum]|uniref:uncharacterized protein LOC113279633 n=1 Tax=Papaver somniferum TaxID=3469 RepID=UPI000E6FFC6B|nr:uncharacterized protein LOC113279633 [Papaver somniferum]